MATGPRPSSSSSAIKSFSSDDNDVVRLQSSRDDDDDDDDVAFASYNDNLGSTTGKWGIPLQGQQPHQQQREQQPYGKFDGKHVDGDDESSSDVNTRSQIEQSNNNNKYTSSSGYGTPDPTSMQRPRNDSVSSSQADGSLDINR